MSILWRIFLSIWCAISVILAVVMFASFQAGTRLNDSLYSVTAYPLIDEARQVLGSGGEAALVDWLANTENFPPGIAMYVLNEAANDILDREFPGFLWPRAQGPDGVASWASEETRRPTLTGPNGRRYIPFVGPTAQPPFGVLGVPSIQWIVLLTAIVASGLVCLLLTKSLTKRLKRLASAAEALSRGKMDTRVNLDAKDEIGVVAQQFDRMAEVLQRQIQSRQEFFRNVSHEMRSPLARIQLALELAEHDPETTPEQLLRIRSETTYLEKMMSQILDLARLEDPDREDSFEVVDLVEIVDLVVSDARFEGEARGQQITWTPPTGDYPVLAHIDLLRSAIENVVRNAICHTAAGTKVSVHLKMTGATATIEVQDSGEGVLEENLDHIFEPFYRGESRQSKGAGLGLAICRQAIDLMKGTIRAASAPGSGLRVSLSFPLSTSGAATT